MTLRQGIASAADRAQRPAARPWKDRNQAAAGVGFFDTMRSSPPRPCGRARYVHHLGQTLPSLRSGLASLLLRIGGLALGGLSLPQILRAEASPA